MVLRDGGGGHIATTVVGRGFFEGGDISKHICANIWLGDAPRYSGGSENNRFDLSHCINMEKTADI